MTLKIKNEDWTIANPEQAGHLASPVYLPPDSIRKVPRAKIFLIYFFRRIWGTWEVGMLLSQLSMVLHLFPRESPTVEELRKEAKSVPLFLSILEEYFKNGSMFPFKSFLESTDKCPRLLKPTYSGNCSCADLEQPNLSF